MELTFKKADFCELETYINNKRYYAEARKTSGIVYAFTYNDVWLSRSESRPYACFCCSYDGILANKKAVEDELYRLKGIKSKTVVELKEAEIETEAVKEEPKADLPTEPMPTQKVATPIIKTEGGKVIIEAEKEATVKYTTNGKDVKSTNKVYSEPFGLGDIKVIKAIAFLADNKSEQAELKIGEKA